MMTSARSECVLDEVAGQTSTIRRYDVERDQWAPVSPLMTFCGKRQGSDTQFPIINPATEEPIGFAPECTEEQLNFAVAAASEAQRRWAVEPFSKRRELVLQLADILKNNREELGHLLVLEQGKPLARALGEIDSSVNYCRSFCDMNLDVQVLEDSAGRRVELHRTPLGVVGAITPWNYPILLAFWKIPAALLAGNAVVLKPSSLAPLAVLRFGELAKDIFPPGIFNVISGDRMGALLASHPGVQKIAFTGSTETGRKIMAAGAPTLKHLTLELGGNDAGILLDDADLSKIADDLFWASFSNCGQVCAGLKRLFVPDALYEEACERLTAIARTVVIGDGRMPEVQVGPIQNAGQFARVRSLVEDAWTRGAKVIYGSNPETGKGFFHPITLVVDATEGMRAVDEEQFGPVLPLLRYRDLDDAIRRANATQFGLGASVWGTDIDKAIGVASRLEAGSVWVNQHPSMGPNIPFGGIKASGIGVELSQHGLEEFTNITVRSIKRPN